MKTCAPHLKNKNKSTIRQRKAKRTNYLAFEKTKNEMTTQSIKKATYDIKICCYYPFLK